MGFVRRTVVRKQLCEEFGPVIFGEFGRASVRRPAIPLILPFMPLASRATRLLAQFLDSLFGLIAFIPAGIFMLVDETAGGLALVAAVLFYIGYLLFADALPGGQSMGKRMLGMAVVDHRTYQPCTGGQSFVRNLLLCILGFFDWIFILGGTKRRLGDIVAGTIVISTTPVYQAAPYQSGPAWPS